MRQAFAASNAIPGRCALASPYGWCCAQRIKISMIAGGNHTEILVPEGREGPLSQLRWQLSQRESEVYLGIRQIVVYWYILWNRHSCGNFDLLSLGYYVIM